MNREFQIRVGERTAIPGRNPSAPEPPSAICAILVWILDDVEAGPVWIGVETPQGGRPYSRPTPTLKNHFSGFTSSVV